MLRLLKRQFLTIRAIPNFKFSAQGAYALQEGNLKESGAKTNGLLNNKE